VRQFTSRGNFARTFPSPLRERGEGAWTASLWLETALPALAERVRSGAGGVGVSPLRSFGRSPRRTIPRIVPRDLNRKRTGGSGLLSPIYGGEGRVRGWASPAHLRWPGLGGPPHAPHLYRSAGRPVPRTGLGGLTPSRRGEGAWTERIQIGPPILFSRASVADPGPIHRSPPPWRQLKRAGMGPGYGLRPFRENRG
jgi:hypothetical protein